MLFISKKGGASTHLEIKITPSLKPNLTLQIGNTSTVLKPRVESSQG